MTAAQEAARQRIRAERIFRKRQRLGVLSALLDMQEKLYDSCIIDRPNGCNGCHICGYDDGYVKGLKFRIQKCRNELRNMGAPYTVPPMIPEERVNAQFDSVWI